MPSFWNPGISQQRYCDGRGNQGVHRVCAYDGVGKGMLWGLLEQELSLWTISCMNCREPGARKVQSSSRRKQRHWAYVCVCLCVCVGVCMCVTIIRATTLSNSRGTIYCVFCGLLGGTIHATCSTKDTPWICATQRPWAGW